MSYDDLLAALKSGESDIYFNVDGTNYSILIDVYMYVPVYRLGYSNKNAHENKEFIKLDDLLSYKLLGGITLKDVCDKGIRIELW